MVGDLGLGKALDMSSRLTMIAGTPTFVAPEQAQGERLGPGADQYSLGALAYLLLTGRAPYSHASLRAAATPGEMPSLSTEDRPFPAAVDDVVRRALAPDADDRWPDVTAFVVALREALGDRVGEGLPDRWLPIDPQLTQPGARPSALPSRDSLPDPTPPGRPSRRRRLLALGALGLVGAVAGGAAGYAYVASDKPDVTVSDDSGSLEVTVPHAWAGAVSTAAWTPPGAEATYPALSVGSAADWTDTSGEGQGAFLGIFPGEELPTLMPQHPECDHAEDPVSGGGADPSTTIVHTGCPDGVTVERVVQVAANRLLWVQVRSVDRATAARVLDAVETRGL